MLQCSFLELYSYSGVGEQKNVTNFVLEAEVQWSGVEGWLQRWGVLVAPVSPNQSGVHFTNAQSVLAAEC